MKAKMILALELGLIFLAFSLIPAGQRAAVSHSSTLPRTSSAKQPSSKTEKNAAALPGGKASSAPVSASTAPLTAARITGVAIAPGDNGGTVVQVGTTRLVHFKHFHLRNPERLVLDLENTETAHFERIYPNRAGTLEDVRVAQFQAQPLMVTRVVADLAASEPTQITSGPEGVRIQFQNLSPRPVQQPAVSAPRPLRIKASNELSASISETVKRTNKPVRRPHAVVGVKDGRAIAVAPVLPDKSVAELVDLTRPVKVNWAAIRASHPAPARSDDPAVVSTTNTGNTIQATTPRAKWASVEMRPPVLLPQAQQALRAAEVLSGSAPAGQTPVISSIRSTTGTQQAPPVYTGKLISLDLKAVDIRDFFRLIHQVSGLNIIVDSDVTGKVTMSLDDVPWDQALGLVLKNNGLGKVLEGNVLRIAQVKTLMSEAEAQSNLQEARIESEPLVTVIRRLKYAHAADEKPNTGGSSMGGGGGSQSNTQPIPGVATILKSFQKGSVLTDRGTVVADPRDNAVIITDVASQIPVIESVIDQLDKKSKQVSIQVRVILANSVFTRSLSALLSGGFGSAKGHTNGAGGTGQGITGVAPLSPPLPPLSAVTQPASVAASGFGAFSITTAAARYAINAAITAAETHNQARTISRPTIVTQDNVLGEVQQGVQVPIQTDINNTIAIQYVNATLMLSVTPQVTVDNKIFLKIYVNNASIGTVGVFAGPTINTQQATTQVLVPDGGTVVFGGITVTTRGRSATYVPLLGSIPVLGNLFKSSAVNDQNQELLFFVSPMILPG